MGGSLNDKDQLERINMIDANCHDETEELIGDSDVGEPMGEP